MLEPFLLLFSLQSSSFTNNGVIPPASLATPPVLFIVPSATFSLPSLCQKPSVWSDTFSTWHTRSSASKHKAVKSLKWYLHHRLLTRITSLKLYLQLCFAQKNIIVRRRFGYVYHERLVSPDPIVDCCIVCIVVWDYRESCVEWGGVEEWFSSRVFVAVDGSEGKCTRMN